ncbi:MAG TPA: enoyl-CoA hydratase/isomerase family protein [Streptomyces sp.]
MSYDDLPALTIDVSDGVATVAIDNPPLQLMDAALMSSLWAFVARVRDDADVRVIVFESADPEFFITHADMAYFTDPDALPAAVRGALDAAPGSAVPEGMNILQAMSEEIRSLPQVTIGKLAGFARGAGNEFFMYLDMRFAAIGKSGQGQTESLLGILPGGGGTVNMTRLAGRARTLELILGAELVGAELAERYGLINRAVPAEELDAFVDTLARRIAGLRPEVIALTKAAVDAVVRPIPHEAYVVENEALYEAIGDDVMERAHKLLAAGLQTREGERDHERIAGSV